MCISNFFPPFSAIDSSGESSVSRSPIRLQHHSSDEEDEEDEQEEGYDDDQEATPGHPTAPPTKRTVEEDEDEIEDSQDSQESQEMHSDVEGQYNLCSGCSDISLPFPSCCFKPGNI